MTDNLSERAKQLSREIITKLHGSCQSDALVKVIADKLHSLVTNSTNLARGAAIEQAAQKVDEIWDHEGQFDNCKVCRTRDAIRSLSPDAAHNAEQRASALRLVLNYMHDECYIGMSQDPDDCEFDEGKLDCYLRESIAALAKSQPPDGGKPAPATPNYKDELLAIDSLIPREPNDCRSVYARVLEAIPGAVGPQSTTQRPAPVCEPQQFKCAVVGCYLIGYHEHVIKVPFQSEPQPRKLDLVNGPHDEGVIFDVDDEPQPQPPDGGKPAPAKEDR